MYRWIDHTSEVEVAIEAPTEAAVLEEALAALAELLTGPDGGESGGEQVSFQVAVDAPDRPALLAEWLSELAYLAEREGLVPERASGLNVADGHAEAAVTGRRGRPPHLVKAVTYHRLAFEPADGGYVARAILDV